MFLEKIQKVISIGTVKSHARCKGVGIKHLLHRHINVTQEENKLVIKCGRHVESFELTKHKSGTFYMHWIRLNQCLIKLHLKVSDFRSWMIPPKKPDTITDEDVAEMLSSEWRYLAEDALGVSREAAASFSLTEKEIRKQYRTLARIFHPDREDGDAELFGLLKGAEETLLFTQVELNSPEWC